MIYFDCLVKKTDLEGLTPHLQDLNSKIKLIYLCLWFIVAGS